MSDAIWIVSYFARIPSLISGFRCQQRASFSANSDRCLLPIGSFFSSSIKVSTQAIGDTGGLKNRSVDDVYCPKFPHRGFFPAGSVQPFDSDPYHRHSPVSITMDQPKVSKHDLTWIEEHSMGSHVLVFACCRLSTISKVTYFPRATA